MIHSPETIQSLFNQLSEGIYIVDPERKIIFWNDASERITGYSREQVIGRFCQSNVLRHVDDQGERLCLDGCPLAATLLDGKVREANVYLNHAAGHRVSVAVRVLPLMENGQITGAVEVFMEEVSLASALMKISELQQVAMLDELTRVGNRRMAISRLQLAHHEWEQEGTPYGVLIADIDYFKQFNDSYGHETGDRVLQMVARSLSSGLSPYDFIGRWGGEEFIIVLSNLHRQSLKVMAERLRMLVEYSHFSLSSEWDGGDSTMQVTLSIGGAMIDSGEDQFGLIRRADQLMYQSKASGRNRVTV
jgi:diguanylate cyclase (GGDEF)-like protein/PAS domain S-box-containing protein